MHDRGKVIFTFDMRPLGLETFMGRGRYRVETAPVKVICGRNFLSERKRVKREDRGEGTDTQLSSLSPPLHNKKHLTLLLHSLVDYSFLVY